MLLAEMRRRIEELEQENTDLRDDQEAAERVRAMPHLVLAADGAADGFVARGFQERVIAAEAAAQAITSLELVVREKELMLELAEIKHDEEKEKMVRPFDPHPLRRWMKS